MRIKKNINNNVSLCIDDNGNEVVVFGKGVGFIKQGDIIELNRIERTFYNFDKKYISMLNDISPTSINIAEKVLNYGVDLEILKFNGSLLFGLGDHIDFAIERYKKGINFNLPIKNDINHLFPKEMLVGKYALKIIKEVLNIDLPYEEATYIALNIINSEYNTTKDESSIDEETINDIVIIIETSMKIKLDKDTFSYSRFISHMHYLMKRNDKSYGDKNGILYKTMKKTCPVIYACTNKISQYFNDKFGYALSNDECLYLMIHISRICDLQQ